MYRKYESLLSRLPSSSALSRSNKGSRLRQGDCNGQKLSLQRLFPRLARILVFLMLGASGVAEASFHLWRITKNYSNADGSVQFIELTAYSSGQQFIAGHAITSSQGTQTRTFTFPTNLPGETAITEGGGGYYGGGYTKYKTFLIGTQGFAVLNVVTPDYIVPNGFLFTTNASVTFGEGSEVVSYTSLPTTGGRSISANGASAMYSPTNFARASGSIAAPATGRGWLQW